MKLSIFLSELKKYVANYKNLTGINCDLGTIIDCPVFVINLERSNLRRDFILKYLTSFGLDVRIFNAVEGNKLNLSELEEKGIYNKKAAHEAFSRQLSMPEIGCSLSHIGVYQKIVDENIDKALILEDDIIFIENIEQHFQPLLRDIPNDWDIIQIYYKCKDYHKITNSIVKFRSKECMPTGAAGYFIKRSAADIILKNVYPIRYPADSLIARTPRWGTVIYGSLPALLSQNFLFPTDIQTRTNLSSNIRDAAKRFIVKVISKLFNN